MILLMMLTAAWFHSCLLLSSRPRHGSIKGPGSVPNDIESRR